MTKTLIAPSILAADFANLADEIKAIEAAGAEWVHLDIMDGHFVPNITFGAPIVKKLRKHTNMVFDAHLMIENVDRYIKGFADAGVDRLTIHPESEAHIHRSLQYIKDCGMKAGLALNPATPASVIAPVLDLLDLVLVMSVNPGFGGQKFIPSQIDKIKQVKTLTAGFDIDIQVDGGITPEIAPAAIDAGANVLVAGTAVFGASDYKAVIDALKNA